ncbi:MAG: putative bifunctional diguanylate cyclase/phosphodiesterase [Lysobacterales bacterium]
MLIGAKQLQEIDQVLAAGDDAACAGILLVHLRGMRQMVALLGLDCGASLMDAAQARLRELLRPADRIYRVASNEFLVCLPGLLSTNHGVLAARKVLGEFDFPLSVQNRPMTPVLSLALAVNAGHRQERRGSPHATESLIRNAMTALHQGLELNSRFVLADDSSADLWLQDELRDALINNELSLAFQPVFALEDRRIVAVEALARWSSTRHGVIPPSRFVALAEQTGLAHELTRWSINAVLREYAQLRLLAPQLRCAINLSPKVFGQSGLVEQISGALAIWDIPPTRLMLEVTETAVMEDPELSSVSLHHLRTIGVEIAIDDFGQGYSSFTYLKHFPATELKIDQSFVTPMASDGRACQLVRAMVDLAHHLDMRAVAEGVEDAEALTLLEGMGCDMAQGYHLAHPMTVSELGAMLKAQA